MRTLHEKIVDLTQELGSRLGLEVLELKNESTRFDVALQRTESLHTVIRLEFRYCLDGIELHWVLHPTPEAEAREGMVPAPLGQLHKIDAALTTIYEQATLTLPKRRWTKADVISAHARSRR